ncbi:MAG: phosphopantetheine-binding protein [Verrucomicrobia bacterium]|nr:phosphopantetheine-binding protein [Verrucomicrobiota bacterium]
MPESISSEATIRESLKRCPEATIKAAIEFRQTRDPSLLPVIVMGVIERFIEPDVRPLLREGDAGLRLVDDLGVDSLLMVEIVMLIEEVLELSIDNEELRNIRTIGDIQTFLDAKVRGVPLPDNQNLLRLESILAIMPQQPPFLFLQEARVNGESIEGTYRISGDEPFLEGHFKGDPVFPGSLMLEALGQLAVLYLLRNVAPTIPGGIDPGKVYFVSCDGVRCHRVCRPPETLQLVIKLKKLHAPIAQFEGWIYSQGVKVAKVEELGLAFQQPQQQEAAPAEPATVV